MRLELLEKLRSDILTCALPKCFPIRVSWWIMTTWDWSYSVHSCFYLFFSRFFISRIQKKIQKKKRPFSRSNVVWSNPPKLSDSRGIKPEMVHASNSLTDCSVNGTDEVLSRSCVLLTVVFAAHPHLRKNQGTFECDTRAAVELLLYPFPVLDLLI